MQYDVHKLTPERLSRKAIVYLRQSSRHQVIHNRESQRLQYALAERATAFGFKEVETVDDDLGVSASAGANRRVGFERVLSQVALGQVGLVLSREVSRLSRTDKDWCQLIEVCRLFDTLIGDEDGLYDLNTMNDQLILGVKGTISVVELRTLQLRLREGARAKAARGELHQGPLVAGYVIDATGQLVKNPNKRVQNAVQQIFTKFADAWSIRQTFQWFRDHGIEVPVSGAQRQLRWRIPSHEYIAGTLHNPIFAGAYAHGRIQTETSWQDGRLVKRNRVKKLDEWHVLLRDHHEGYISWETFEENQRRIGKNVSRRTDNDSEMAVRSGKALLAGLLRCGWCGRRLGVRYTGGPKRNCPQYNCQGDYKAGGRKCQWIGGAVLERHFEQELLAVLSPHGVQASFVAKASFDREYAEQREMLARQLQQVSFEAQRAFEQYDVVDARNRLVAEELEQRWNNKLREEDRLKQKLHELENTQQPLTDEQRLRIEALGAQFESVWASAHCSPDLKKKIIRTVIEEIVVTRDDATSTIRMVIHWKGGAHTDLEIPWSRRHPQETAPDAVDIIRKMAKRFGDEDIARVLNQEGYRTGQGNQWEAPRVASLRNKHDIPGRRRTEPRAGFISLNAAIEFVGVSDQTILKLIKRGLIYAEQVVPRAPWEIRESDLRSDRVSQIIQHLQRTGRLPNLGDSTDRQHELFQ